MNPEACNIREHRPQWVVRHRRHNHSAFHNGFQRSAFSEVECPLCVAAWNVTTLTTFSFTQPIGRWRTKAAYVATLPGECS